VFDIQIDISEKLGYFGRTTNISDYQGKNEVQSKSDIFPRRVRVFVVYENIFMKNGFFVEKDILKKVKLNLLKRSLAKYNSIYHILIMLG